jgi:hypothetical protein
LHQATRLGDVFVNTTKVIFEAHKPHDGLALA